MEIKRPFDERIEGKVPDLEGKQAPEATDEDADETTDEEDDE